MCHCGRFATWIRPWLWQKRIIVAIGKRSIWSVGQDQMQPIIGRKYQSRNSFEKRFASRNSPIDCESRASSPPTASAVAVRLKRSTSASMRQKRGRSRFARWANTVLRSEPLHSRPRSGTCTENDMSDGAVSTPNSANNRSRFGYVRSLSTRKPVSTPWVTPSRVTSTVCVCPPK